jgi:PAS domain S-box-containing protein
MTLEQHPEPSLPPGVTQPGSPPAQQLLEGILRETTDAIYAKDFQGRYTFINESALQFVGKSLAEVLGLDDHALFGGLEARAVMAGDRRVMDSGLTETYEEVLTTSTGIRTFLSTKSPIRDDRGQVIGIIGIARDITLRKQAEVALRRSNRSLRMISDCNQALIRATEEKGLLEDVCRIIVEQGQYRFAWVGFAEQDASCSVRPVARAGFEDGYLDTIRVTWADEDRGRGPTGRAIRMGRTQLTRNIPEDPYFNRWKQAAQRSGYLSSVAIPLRSGDRIMGALNVYAERPDAFDGEEVGILEELAGDLAYGLEAMRTRAAHAQAELDLKVSEQHLRFALEQSRIGGWDLDLATRTAYRSPEHARIFGYEDLLSPWSFEVFLGHVLPEDRDRVRQSFQQALSEGTGLDFECQIRRKDGQVRWIWASGSCYPDAAGRPIRLTGIVQDLTERKQEENELRASREKFRKAFHSAPMMMVLSSIEEGRIFEVNDEFCRITGYTREELIGKTSTELGYVERADRVRLAEALRVTGRVDNYEIATRSKAGIPIYWLLCGEIVELDGERVLLSMATDITERRRHEEERRGLEAQLHHLQRLESVGRLAGGIAHDMNNVLAAIMGVASLLALKAGDQQRPAELILEATMRGRDLLRRLMDFARSEVGEVEVLDLNDLLRREAEILANTTLQRIKIELDLDPNLPRLSGSMTALSTALMNLCVNAVDAMPEGGTLRLRTALRSGKDIELSVADNGQGMSPEVRARAMEPFFTTKPSGKGTGLGLSIVFGTVQAHGGRVEVDSEVGVGTTFRLLFPASVPRPGSTKALEGPGVTVPSGPKRLLLVDDDPLVLEAAVTFMESLGHQVTGLADGQQALDLLARDATCDAILLDQNMPGLTGVETLRRLRGLGIRVPVVITTGYVDDELQAAVADKGQVVILSKPYTHAEFQATLAALL